MIGVELFPNIVLSTLDPVYNLTIENDASSTKSLKIIMMFVLIGAILVIAYTVFAFYIFRGKISLDKISY
ncbi:MAG: cytochrome d ubiquinol oxidase subunit II [Flavobacteriales bacterium]